MNTNARESKKAGYREHMAVGRLAPFVECFWSLESDLDIPEYPVLPDGCVDIVCSPGRAGEPQVVGAMTHARRYGVSAGQFDCGVRFRPGMSSAFLRVPATETTDQSLALGDVWGAAGRRVGEQLGQATSAEQCIALLEAQLVNPAEPGTVQRVAAYIVENSGQVRVDDLAFDAGMSERQLRRLFL